MSQEAADLRPDDVRLGLSHQFQHEITSATVVAFADVSGDHNPLHVDAEYAANTNHGKCIVQGAYQVGLASAMLGMHLPGRRALLTGLNARFTATLAYPCRVTVRGEVTAWNPAQGAGRLKVVVQELENDTPTAEIWLGFSLHDAAARVMQAPPATAGSAVPASRTVVVTGAAGGLGSAIVGALAARYKVVALVRNTPLVPELSELPSVTTVEVDLHAPDLEERLTEHGPLFGIVHAAWPGLPKGSLLEMSDEVLRRQLDFGALSTIRLARTLFRHTDPDGGRFVALSTVVASHAPVVSLSGYGLAKATMEQTVRLLAPELARKAITINAIAPTYIAAGLHGDSHERQRKLETARNPMGRLCTPEDVAGMVAFLLGPDSSFVSGQVVGLSGGQL